MVDTATKKLTKAEFWALADAADITYSNPKWEYKFLVQIHYASIVNYSNPIWFTTKSVRLLILQTINE